MNRTLTAVLCLLTISIYAQDSVDMEKAPEPIDSLSKKAIKRQRPTYLVFGYGRNFSNFRDFATSPLIYKGVANKFDVARHKFDKKRESYIGVSYSGGSYAATVEDDLVGQSSVTTAFLHVSQLWRINKISSGKWNFKAGWAANNTINMRVNPSFQNNQLGLEDFATLFVSGKVEFDADRKEAKDKKFLFIKYHLKPRKRDLNFLLNVGVKNNTVRNGYVYTNSSGPTNDYNIFQDYQFKAFSGFRMSTTLDYIIYMRNNKNAYKFSYTWDAYKSGGDLDKFEMAHHTLGLAFLFRTN